MSKQPIPEEVVAQAEAVVESAASAPTGEEAAPEAQHGVENGEAAEEVPNWETATMERTVDLQRLQAERANYEKRVDHDRVLARQLGIEAVVTGPMPVLDSIQLTKSHGDLGGGFRMVTDGFEKVAAKYGLVIFGAVGDPFGLTHHEALMGVPLEEEVTMTAILQVVQSGYQLRDHMVRPARVTVANPR